MRTRLWAVVFMLTFILASISACGKDASPSISERSTTFSVLPGTFSCGEYSLALNDVFFYQEYANHGYIGRVLITLDRSGLTDDDIYWMTNRVESMTNVEVDAIAYIRESGYGDRIDTRFVGKTQDSKNIYYLYETDIQRKEFKDENISVQIISNPDLSITSEATTWYYYGFDLDPASAYTFDGLDASSQHAVKEILS